MVFTIEPMLTLGTVEWEQWEDNWTIVTADRSRTAQFEQHDCRDRGWGGDSDPPLSLSTHRSPRRISRFDAGCSHLVNGLHFPRWRPLQFRDDGH